MKKFHLWYIYYDSLFSSTNPQIPLSLIQRQNCKKIQWPDIQPIQLSYSFRNLQQFIKNKQNWFHSSCTIQQLQNIQDNLNYLLLLLNLQKQYANQFWKQDKRRIQSSVTHIYIFIQIFVKSIIPYPTMTIFQCKTANKLSVNINNLQNLINNIRKSLNSIYKFFSNQMFQEQTDLTKNFFQHWLQLLKRLPNIKKQKFDHLPQLIKYINLTNQIQVWKKKQNKKKTKIIKKISGEQYKSDTEQEVTKYYNLKANIKVFYGTIYSIRKSSTSCNARTYEPQNLKINRKQIIQKIFCFPQQKDNIKEIQKRQILKGSSTSYSIQNSPIEQRNSKKKSQTVRNYQNQKQESMSRNSISPSLKIKRLKTIAYQGNRSPKIKSVSISRELTSSYDDLDQIQEQRKKVKIQSIQKKQKKDKRLKYIKQLKQQKYQRQQKIFKQNLEMKQQARLFYDKDKKKDIQLQFDTGRKFSRGWQFIRDYVNDRITKRKLNRLLAI